jgi:murein DD-endopeptidase MepM/ murein hydrolase activator NlpD
MRLALASLLLLLLAVPAAAQRVYKWTDEKGVVHYSDRAPPEEVQAETFRVRAEPQNIARLRLVGDGGERSAWATNTIAGPVEVELRFATSDNARAEPGLPLRRVLQPFQEAELTRIGPADRRRQGSFELSFNAVPGDSSARHDDFPYLLPVDTSDWRIDQGWGGAFSHSEPASRYAIDLRVAEGTPVLAARDGLVIQREHGFEGAGLDFEKYAQRANHVRVLHDDGSMAVYAHLQPDSVVVAVGRRVRAGQVIARSGNTGYSSGPHLHFAIQLNTGLKLESVPFRMQGPAGPVAIPGS